MLKYDGSMRESLNYQESEEKKSKRFCRLRLYFFYESPERMNQEVQKETILTLLFVSKGGFARMWHSKEQVFTTSPGPPISRPILLSISPTVNRIVNIPSNEKGTFYQERCYGEESFHLNCWMVSFRAHYDTLGTFLSRFHKTSLPHFMWYLFRKHLSRSASRIILERRSQTRQLYKVERRSGFFSPHFHQ